MKLKHDHGNVVVEFVCIAIMLLIPISYLATAASNVAQKYLAINSATTTATRAFVVQTSDQRGRNVANQIVKNTLRLHQINAKSIQMKIACSAHPCLNVDNLVTVTLSGHLPIQVPALGKFNIPVRVSQTLEVDEIQ